MINNDHPSHKYQHEHITMKIHTNINRTAIIIRTENIKNSGFFNGCAIRHFNDILGYSSNWNASIFEELLPGEEIDFQISESIFINNKIYIIGERLEDCIIDLKNKKLIIGKNNIKDSEEVHIKLKIKT